MIPVYQKQNDDCMSAAWASILECPLEDVPNFNEAGGLLESIVPQHPADKGKNAFWHVHDLWLESIGIHAVVDSYRIDEWGLGEALDHVCRDDVEPCYRILLAGSVGSAYARHALVVLGSRIVHDPGYKIGEDADHVRAGLYLVVMPPAKSVYWRFLLPVRKSDLLMERSS